MRRLATGSGVHSVRFAIPAYDPDALRAARAAFVASGTSFEQTVIDGAFVLMARQMSARSRRAFCAW